ncbi:hypothetical protein QBC41DRAFT_334851 [Cercophora samala]|uniref:Uncharacterized protein n=1 Tax=Cercophora samala TaxID=330535 RepID=A0AA39ZJC1_9PEZI|nr:hypothetical protein QBC41DRAFT_334851 [Cercophora samala]
MSLPALVCLHLWSSQLKAVDDLAAMHHEASKFLMLSEMACQSSKSISSNKAIKSFELRRDSNSVTASTSVSDSKYIIEDNQNIKDMKARITTQEQRLAGLKEKNQRMADEIIRMDAEIRRKLDRMNCPVHGINGRLQRANRGR